MMSDVKVENLSDINLTSGIAQYVTHCPNCASLGKRHDDYKLSISLEKNVYHCYRCGCSGKATSLLKGYVNSGDLIRYRLNFDEMEFERPNDPIISSELIDYDNISQPIDPMMINAYAYLKNRHISLDDIHKHNIRIGKGLYKGRILIPTYDKLGNIVYLTAREYVDLTMENKYFNPPGSHKALAVWNIQNISEGDKVIVTEGVFSGMAANRNIPEAKAVSIFGKVISETQARMISEARPSEVILCFDGDVTKKGILFNFNEFRKYYTGEISVLKLSGEEDPDSIDPELFKKKYANRMSAIKFKIVGKN